MALQLTTLAKTLTRRAALDDLMLTLMAARYGVRLLRLAARNPAERGVADALVTTLDEAEAAIRRL